MVMPCLFQLVACAGVGLYLVGVLSRRTRMALIGLGVLTPILVGLELLGSDFRGTLLWLPFGLLVVFLRARGLRLLPLALVFIPLLCVVSWVAAMMAGYISEGGFAP